MNHNNIIKQDIINKKPNHIIARRVFMYEPTFVFDNCDCFNIINEISNYFNIKFNHILIVGSGKTGYSYHKEKEFVKGCSDLDVAIIDSNLFINYMEKVNLITNNYNDMSKFKRDYKTNTNLGNKFKHYLIRGIFRPDLMPNCIEKNEWFGFFNKLSENYIDYFKNINCGLYLSQYHFERKQASLVNNFKASKYYKA